jgi:hypothetical protein
MIIGQDVSRGHIATSCQHLVRALDGLGADALARLTNPLVSIA